MKRISICLMTFFILLLGLTTSQAATNVQEFRWVTRNDSRVPFVRMVFDVDKLPDVDALLSKDGKNLKVTLMNTRGKNLKDTYVLDPKIISHVSMKQEKKNLVVSIDVPKKLMKNKIKIFPLKKDKEHKKPYRIVVDIPKASLPVNFKTTAGLKGKTIVIDPGHGGTDTGAISPRNLYEKNVTLPIAKYLKPLLEEKGAKVIMTRYDDHDVYGPYASAENELQARVDVAEENKADLLLSIHIDSFTKPEINGVSTYYNDKTDYDIILAESLHKFIKDVPNFGDRGVRTANFYLLVNSSMPAALVELGFLSNKDDEARLRKDSVRKEFAKALAKGLEEYFDRAAKESA